ncbi:MAG: hypothetical protein E7018_07025 [Alphaproteobacteria bacterium]|nr:hypothetical protein [Alphaproteobacteria bacterium]
MKKLIYIILVIAILLTIGFLVKKEVATSEPELVVVEETITTNEVIGDGEVIEETAETATEQVDAVVEDVVETNPEETADEGETFVD